MVHKMDSGDRVLHLIEALEDEQFAEPSDTRSELPPRTATSAISVAVAVTSEVKDILQVLVDQALKNGATWAEIAKALGLANASSAHYLYGPKSGAEASEAREEKLAKQRERIAAYRKSLAPKEEVPGLSAIEAGRRLGLDRRTVKQRALRGEIETTTVTSANGTETMRFLLSEEPSAGGSE
jgi:DNA-binding transcriptional MerR regulator